MVHIFIRLAGLLPNRTTLTIHSSNRRYKQKAISHGTPRLGVRFATDPRMAVVAGDCRTRLPLGCSLRVPISIAAISLIGKARLVALIRASISSAILNKSLPATTMPTDSRGKGHGRFNGSCPIAWCKRQSESHGLRHGLHVSQTVTTAFCCAKILTCQESPTPPPQSTGCAPPPA